MRFLILKRFRILLHLQLLLFERTIPNVLGIQRPSTSVEAFKVKRRHFVNLSLTDSQLRSQEPKIIVALCDIRRLILRPHSHAAVCCVRGNFFGRRVARSRATWREIKKSGGLAFTPGILCQPTALPFTRTEVY